LINIEILANEYATDIFHEIAKKKGIDFAKMNVIESLNAMFETKGELRQVLSSEKEEIYRCILDGMNRMRIIMSE
jgi:cytidylate kinase